MAEEHEHEHTHGGETHSHPHEHEEEHAHGHEGEESVEEFVREVEQDPASNPPAGLDDIKGG